MLPIVKAFIHKNSKLEIAEALRKIVSRVKIPETWQEALDMLSQSYIINTLSKRQKVAYVDGFEKVQNVMFQLKLQLYMEKNSITVSKKPYASINEHWYFFDMPWSA